mmetsp:Transcript_14805/g.37991  ORF Transcript_14805/g.37991 Transcript_14805/m.37991 type:complete len:407 (+) Transcript_14805:329-1549(+)
MSLALAVLATATYVLADGSGDTDGSGDGTSPPGRIFTTTTQPPEFRDGCPDAIDFFRKMPAKGRASNGAHLMRAQRKMQGDLVTVRRCAEQCERNPLCDLFEYRGGGADRMCTFWTVPADVALNTQERRNNKWRSYTRVATRCIDGTCNCPTFHVPTTTTEEPEDRGNSDCVSPLSDQFTQIPSAVIRKRQAYTVAEFIAEDAPECLRRCVHFPRLEIARLYPEGLRPGDFDFELPDSLGIDMGHCDAAEYSAVMKRCVLKQRMEGDYRPINLAEIPLKPSDRFSLFVRTRPCYEDMPDGVCVSDDPLSLFMDPMVSTKPGRGSRKSKGRATSVLDCAARCLEQHRNKNCVGFDFVHRDGGWGSCVLYREYDPMALVAARQGHMFYARRDDGAACDMYDEERLLPL